MKYLNGSVSRMILAATLGLCSYVVPAFAEEEAAVAPELVEVSHCQLADYVQGSATNTIKIVGHTFSPKCLRVPVGAQVTIQAGGIHPLQGQPEINGAANPLITSNGGATSPVTITLRTVGQIGYYCENHGSPDGEGMAGAILVQ